MKRVLGMLLLGSFLSLPLIAQQKVRVYFTDKGEHTLDNTSPFAVLSQTAVLKRAERGIDFTYSDLPVSKEYLQAIREMDAEIKMASRWFNFALVSTENPQVLESLPFVKKIEYPDPGYQVLLADVPAVNNVNYGTTEHQIEMLNGDYLHDLNLLGQGMTIAVFDAGYAGALIIEGLDSLLNSERLLGTYSFVMNDSNVFNTNNGNHGTSVLSAMAGYDTGTYVGTAPLANYWLFTTEDVSSETPAEMENWLAAAEKSDSLGVDIITSSLGYSKFDGGIGDYDYDDMDGNTTLITNAADMAAAKGMLVVVSAGNEGASPWQKITAPADGDSVLAIGAVDNDRNLASFSSRGPTYDGRIKPDVLAQGQGTALLFPAGPSGGNGTSFACPLISGMAACLWQSNPSLSAPVIYDAIKFEANNRYTPNNERGFGIANFKNSSWAISLDEAVFHEDLFKVYPNPVSQEFTVEMISAELNEATEVHYKIFNLEGREISKGNEVLNNSKFTVQSPEERGTYIIMIEAAGVSFLSKIQK